MSVRINKSECVACKRCVNICPGNLIRVDNEGKAFLKNFSDCWSCMACMKECPAGAITLTLPPELEGKGGVLSVKQNDNLITWTINKANGESVTLVTDLNEANNY